jgi:uncharacterized membrane protein
MQRLKMYLTHKIYKMKKIIFIVTLLAGAIIISCTKKASPSKSADGAYMPAKARAPAVTYTANVKTLIQARCTPCHIPANGGRKKSFDNYDSTKKYINDIVRRVQLDPAVRGYMPFKNSPLAAEEIALLKKWQEGGAAE